MENIDMNTAQTPDLKRSKKSFEWFGILVLIIAIVILIVYVVPRGARFGGEPNEFGVIPAQDVELSRIQRDLPENLPFVVDEFLVGQVGSKVVQYPKQEKVQYDVTYSTVQSLKEVYLSYYNYTLMSEEGLYPLSSSLPSELDEMTEGQWDALSQALFEARGEEGVSMTVSFSEAGDITRVTLSYIKSR